MAFLPALHALHLPPPPPPTSSRARMDIRALISPEPRYLVKKPLPKDKDTRSKARPGFRKGKWTDEESVYAERMTHYFKEGLLPLEKGTMLRMYLADKLNCEPMRITKKFTGDECIGKQIFRPLPPTPLVNARMQSVQTELKALETAFLHRIEEMPMYCMSTKDKATASNELKLIKRGKLRPRKAMTTNAASEKAKKPLSPPEDAQAACLLLGFFHGAGSSENEDTASVASPIAAGNPFLPVAQDGRISPSGKGARSDDDVAPPTVRPRSTRKFSISHCADECDDDMVLEMKRPRIGSISSLCS
ncbi:hypothetical protein SPRG_20254 [Saprolegnia parasitica CBS 223.65]|uniref:Uncharacterized protein n=1 Tax=Saprolegnia parasitica (strain CBS 223.65) TaxID=695850 RepID=A0A067CBF7_SAPPC|nr:hypothetical protein SPRG_20254 [Saprolegnia parasitica CBS 223.65]KDO28094.1 hypothetical protein SPRG_20254 [Saprolegnia parasitica CBS 223.65]|eukprot:XP_012201238.1 hypothetical protein SPRG_20254 [Saprolegnia parasitica CBS 223.65]